MNKLMLALLVIALALIAASAIFFSPNVGNWSFDCTTVTCPGSVEVVDPGLVV
jgi:hypothetical protein